MKIKYIVAVLASFFIFPTLVSANLGQLTLDKLRLDFNVSLGDSACDELWSFDAGKDVADLREEYPCYNRTGKYTLTLSGPPGTTVTLFGEFNYGKGRGYLIIKKMDDQPVWILDLEPSQKAKWFQSPAERTSGAYEAYYHPAPIFREHVSSFKWGKWWTGESPVGGPANP
ncbi:MAG: hypothetical protein ACE5E9_08060 [Nitrospinaceae bacterium]